MPSRLPVARYLPSGEKVTPQTVFVCPLSNIAAVMVGIGVAAAGVGVLEACLVFRSNWKRPRSESSTSLGAAFSV